MKNLFLLAFVALMVSGCASNYKSFDPHNFNYNKSEGTDLAYSYKTNVLSLTGNKRYAKKEEKFNISLISVKIENNTTETINVSDDVKFMIGGRDVVPLETYFVEEKIKQKNIALYALYGLLFLNTNDNGEIKSYPIGIPIAIGNIALAASSNSKFKENFNQNNIMNKTIKPNETLYGLVAFRDLYSNKLEIKMK